MKGLDRPLHAILRLDFILSQLKQIAKHQKEKIVGAIMPQVIEFDYVILMYLAKNLSQANFVIANEVSQVCMRKILDILLQAQRVEKFNQIKVLTRASRKRKSALASRKGVNPI